ncbi:MAG: HD domain-containing protein [Bdellovibrionaceae bacterium]|nr:HD domain-containing protein [Pseudobdellovibrionaceae bacterium]
MTVQLEKKVIFDNIHGYITLNRVEARILETLYYQRLRWIRQLGFSFYVFPGATHTRHAHALGVLHVMDKVLKSIGKSVTEEKLFNPKIKDESTLFHRTMRLAAMLHDIGTLPFSHTIELAYINHWRQQVKKSKTMANHEELGSHILLNTNFDGGITKILMEEGIDPLELSRIISGTSKNMLANQLMHSDVDADRMDYLLRDAYHTGVKLGVYDMDLLLRNMRAHKIGQKEILCVHENAINVVDSFLVSRYFWYSQIISDGPSYKFDLIAAKIYEYFLENGLAYSFDHLIEKVSQNPNEYFTFNDSYFLAKLHEYLAGRIMHPMIRELSEMLAQRKPPAQIKISPVTPTLIENEAHRKQLVIEVTHAAEWLKEEIHNIDPQAWMIFDIPKRDVMFTKNKEMLAKEKEPEITSRDSVRVLTRHNELKLLIDVSNSLTSILSQYRNFLPRIYISQNIYEKLQKKKVLDKMREKDFK